MLYSLENEFIKITANTYGGELNNLISKKENTEFLWSGDPTYWKYHAPILFPIVGKVKNGEYRVDGKTYELPQHGLGRLSKYSMIEKTDNSITFRLKWSDETLKIYPYKFELFITYTLIENSVKVDYKVKNCDDKEIYFSIGAHPAFLCPILKEEKLEDYYFEFNQKETSEIMVLGADGLFKKEKESYLNDENIIPINLDVFKNDALVFHDLKSNRISLKSKNHNKSLTMDFKCFPYLGLWTLATGAPFVCIEPWYGHADFSDFNGDFKDKAGINKLMLNDIFECSYTLILSE